MITNDTLIRVHKSYIVNSYYIKKLNSDELILTTDTTVPLARRRKKQVQTKIAQNIYEKAESIWNN
ncbi:LytTR family transcriptional regulator DNA-binding domain-containing protein [Agathobacter rectalis]|uniref:LytTR family transcriptional regulator DNA-binding domain-containing protein n=1 Tax=Agathobacter rectalis TaxID=39491 RepID=UPI003A7F1CE3